MTNYLREMADSGYDAEHIGPFHTFMMPWLLGFHNVKKEATIVDIGAGQGHAIIPLYHAGWRDITVIDYDDYNFGFFKTKFNFQTIQCDVTNERINLDDSFVDAVICFHLIEHLSGPENLMSEMRRVLKPGGIVFLVTPDWRKTYKAFWEDPTHLRPFDKVSIARLFRMHGFEVEVHSWNPRYGFGRLKAYKLWPKLGMIGIHILAIARKCPP